MISKSYNQDRSGLFAQPVPAFADGVTLSAAVHELAHLGDEAADLLNQARDGHPHPQAVADWHRRRAAVLVHLSAAHDQFDTEARRAIALYQGARDHAIDALITDGMGEDHSG
ncbi:hypothetical protein [Streptomyces nanshensis]|uniref:hypothetical protein n=1 Tax=Streptomyces nanshensis TaxID=518642 RepID=UPI00085C3BED|nr:hypothetical protein [Streptomyces nanshensis]